MPSHLRIGRSLAFRTFILSVIVASLFAAGCTTSNPMVAPAFPSGINANPDFTVGVAGNFAIMASGSPAPTLAESGALPNGVMFNDPNGTGTLSGTPAAGTQGSYPFTITATNGVGTAAMQSFTLTVVLPPVATSLTAAKSTITAGTSTMLTPVFSAGTGSVTPGPIAVTSGTAVTVTPAATTIYTLTVTNAAGTTATVQTTVTVVPPPSITSFSAAKSTITAGTSTTLTAVFVGAGTVDNGVGLVTTGTAVTVTPGATTTYTLSVTNAAGATAVTAMATVTVVPAPTISSFISGAGTITAGTSTTLTAVFNAGPGGTGSVTPGPIAVTSGTPVTVTPAATITYTLTVTNAAGTAVTATAMVTVVPPPSINSFVAAPSTITAGASTMLTAVFVGTGTVIGVGPVTSGTAVTVTPGATTTYTLSVTNAAGATAVTAMATVTVVPPPAITSFTAVPTTIVVGSSSALTGVFAAGPGGTATVSNAVGALVSGTPVNVSPTVTTTYTLTVTNAAGTFVTAMAMVTVDIPPQITSANNATFTVGANGTFIVMTTGNPTSALTKTGTLPNNVNFVDNGNGTATISGIPATGTAGSYPIMITANNGVSPNFVQTFTLTVSLVQAPQITSASSVIFTAGVNSSFTVMTTGSPIPALTEVGALPGTVAFTDNHNGTATIAGTAAVGNSQITITANNGQSPNFVQTFTLNVVAAPSITSFTAAAPIITLGGSTTLTAVFSGGMGVVDTSVGPVTSGVATGSLSPMLPTTYTLTVTNTATTPAIATMAVTVTVLPVPMITNFMPGSPTIALGTQTTLTPVFSGGTGSINGIGIVTSGQVINVSPTTTTTYTLTVTNTATTPATAHSSVTITVIVPPTIGIAFSPTIIESTSASTLTFTITNTNAIPLTGVTFSDTLSGGLEVALAPNESATCVGTVTATSLTTTVNLSNGMLAANASCTIGVSIASTTNGSLPNITGAISSNEGGTGTTSNSASLTVLGMPTIGVPSPSSGPVGTSVTITGMNFGPSQSAVSGTVTFFNGVSAGTATSWTSTSITVTVPPGAATGNLFVTVLGVESGTQTFTVTTGNPSVAVTVPGPVIFSAATPQAVTFTVSVTNDVAGDVITPTLTLNGGACTTTTCGTLGAVSGGPSSYSFQYTPPTSANLTATTTFTLTVTSNIGVPFNSTTNFTVYPAGARVVTVSGVGQRVAVSSVKTGLTAVVYNDTGNQGATLTLLGSGYACPNTACGTLTPGMQTMGNLTTTGTTGIPYTNLPFTYTAPASVPNPPYDRPMILAVSKTDATKLSQVNFSLTGTPTTNLVVANNSRLNTAFIGGAPITLTANLSGDSGTSKTVTWMLATGGNSCTTTPGPCSNAAGMLTSPSYTYNGNGVTASITYTPSPSVAPASGSATITATSVDTPAATDNFTFNIVGGACPTGTSNGDLKGNYAFKLTGGGANLGYEAIVGSFVADGLGGITGLEDINRTIGPVTTTATPLTFTGTYLVGPDVSGGDDRGCLSLTTNTGVTQTFRMALGTFSGSPSTVTQGRMITFMDNTGGGQRLEGVIMKQDTTAFMTSSLSGNYAFGNVGMDYLGGRVASGGVATASSGITSNFDTDSDDNGQLDTNDTTGSGTYTVAASGRGTSTFTRDYGPGIGNITVNSVFYVVSASENIGMSIDPITEFTPLLTGEQTKQTGSSFTGATLTGSGYVFYAADIDTGTGEPDVVLGQTQITSSSGATASGTLTLQEDDSGTLETPMTGTATFTVASNGRMTLSIQGGSSSGQPVFYLVGSSGAFIVGTDTNPDSSPAGATFGKVIQQVGGPFSDTSVAGQFFAGGEDITTGPKFDDVTVTLTGAAATLNINQDQSGSSGLQANQAQSDSYSFSTSSSPVGSGTVGSSPANPAYAVSNSEIIFLNQNSSEPGIVIIQK